eukprot:6398934-Amphidinium_carterae.1
MSATSCETEAAFTVAGFERAVHAAFDALVPSAKVSGPRFFVDSPFREAGPTEEMVWKLRQCCKMYKEQPSNESRGASLKEAAKLLSIRLTVGQPDKMLQCVKGVDRQNLAITLAGFEPQTADLATIADTFHNLHIDVQEVGASKMKMRSILDPLYYSGVSEYDIFVPKFVQVYS